MTIEKYDRQVIEGTSLTFEVRDGYIRLYECWSEDYVVIDDCALKRLCEKLFEIWFTGACRKGEANHG